MRLEVFLPDDAATERLGARLAPVLRQGDMVCLRGGLGAGKTTLSRGLISGLLGAPTDVPSPTFTLVQTYDTPETTVWHFDLYRLADELAVNPDTLLELGWEEAADGIALVEWPSLAEAQLPPHRLDITLDVHEGKGGAPARRAVLEPEGEDWQDRLHGF